MYGKVFNHESYLTYLLRKQWLQTNEPHCRQLLEKYRTLKKYLPESFYDDERQEISAKTYNGLQKNFRELLVNLID
uniref:Uncharacterized protein n=1 Tax=Romanomermis culicivorax TaxID=13658 RepID=A0A915L5Z1_ROMCU